MTWRGWHWRLPWTLVLAAVVLLALGWIGLARYETLRAQLGASPGGFLGRQVVRSLLALAVMFGTAAIDYRRLLGLSYLLLAGTLVLLVAVFFFPPVNGAHRWIVLGPLRVQPSEPAKVVCVLALARYLMYRENYRRLPGLLLPLAIALLPVVLVLREPDLGTAAVFLPVVFVMLFAAGARLRHLLYVAVAVLLVLPVLWTQMSREQRSRVVALFEQPPPGVRPSDDAYHLYQSKRMLALGGIWGSWLAGQAVDDPAAYRLPEAHSDFIFCLIGERLGWPGLALVLGMFALIGWKAMHIGMMSREPFGRLLAAGLGSLFVVEALINTAMTVGLLPVTGLPLPLVSYGGSGLVAHGFALGLLLSVGARPGYEVAREPFRYVVPPATRRAA